MNSKGHLFISSFKSIIRILSVAGGVYTDSWKYALIGFAIAELLGIVEELVDER